VQKSGDFWTIKYLKAVGEKLKLILGASDFQGKPICWVRSTSGIPNIVLPLLEGIDLNSVEGRALLIRLTALPKVIKPKVVNRESLVSLSAAIQATPKEYDRLYVSSLLRDGMRTMLPYSGSRVIECPSIFEMAHSHDLDFRSDEIREQFAFALKSEVLSPMRALMKDPLWPFNDTNSGYLDSLPNLSEHPIAGTLGFTPEPGGKTRCFAAPSIALRWATYPLLVISREVLRKVPEDCTFNQKHMESFLLKCAKERLTMYSIDQSQATDRFPLEILLESSKLLGIPSHAVDAFGIISRMYYRVPRELHRYLPPTISWKTGQPLGVYPSFNMYALAHHMLVRGLFRRLNRPPMYRILGDDIVISDDIVAKAYIELMEMIGVEINRSKSYVSNTYSEGAGFRVSCDVSLAPGRFPEVTSDNYQSFILDKSLREEVLVSLPSRFELPLKPSGDLTRKSFIKLKVAMMEDPSLKDAITSMTTVKRVPFESISTRYPDLFGQEALVDRKFMINVRDTLRHIIPDLSSRSRSAADRILKEASEFDTIYAKDSQSLVDGIWALKGLSRPRSYAPLESSFSILTLPPEEDIPQVVKDRAYKEELRYRSLKKRLEGLNILQRIYWMSLKPGSILDFASMQEKYLEVHRELLLTEYDPVSPYKAWWSEELLSSSLQGYSSVLDTPKARVTGLVVNEIYSHMVKVLASRGVLPSRLLVSNYSRDYRQLNNCIKLVGFKSLVRDYLI